MDLTNIQPNVVSKGVEGKFFLFYGDPSTRKTTVASKFPNSLLLATEIGYSLIPGVHAVNIDSWTTFRSIIRQLKTQEVKDIYKTIVIDTVGLLADMALKYICDINGVKELSEVPWGRGWGDFKKEFRTQVNYIAQLGYNIVFIAHSDTKRDQETGAITSAIPSIDKRPREAVIALVDFILFLQKEEREGRPGETTVYAYSQLPSIIETKTRARYLSPKFEFTFENLEQEVRAAVEKHENSEQNDNSLVTEDIVKHHTEIVPTTSLEDLIDEVVELATKLFADETTAPSAQSSVASVMKGVRITEATEEHYQQLLTLREALYDLDNT